MKFYETVLLKCLLLFICYIGFLVPLVLSLLFFFPEIIVYDLMLIAVDLSFIICIFLGIKFLKSKPLTYSYSHSSLLFFLIFVILTIVWFVFSPMFTIYQKNWSVDLHFNFNKLTDLTTYPTFFKGYKIFRVLLLGPVLEEIFYRRIILSSLLEKYSVYFSILLSSLLFSAGHVDFDYSFVFLIFGIILGLAYWKTKNLYLTIVLHIFINFLTLFFI